MFKERKIPAIGGRILLVVIGNGFDLDMNWLQAMLNS